jgi:hypothetical protein
MLPMTLFLTRSSRLWTFQHLGLEVVQVWLQKKATPTVFIEIHKGAIFDGYKTNCGEPFEEMATTSLLTMNEMYLIFVQFCTII